MQHEQVVHNKDLPYDCKECNQFFSSMEEMRTHLQRFHSYKKDRPQIAFTVLTIGGRILVKTLNPQMHFISGSLDSSVFATFVPHLKQEQITSNFGNSGDSPMFDSSKGVSSAMFFSLYSII